MAAVVLAVCGAAAWGLHEYGPRFGMYLMPPSPQRYAEIVVDRLDTGYYASGPEWTAARAALVHAAPAARSYEDLYPLIDAATRAAGGKHSVFQPPTAREHAKASDPTLPTVTVSGGVGVVTLPELIDPDDRAQQDYADVVATGIAAHADQACGWIVDVRGNGGGNMYPMLSGVSALLPDGPALSFRTRGGASTSVTVQEDGAGLEGQTIVPVTARGKVSGAPIAVLQDAGTGSSAEAVVTAFRGIEGVRLFGAPTAGYTSANLPIPLYDGARIILTQSIYADRTGTEFPETPITPDEAAPVDAAEAARAWLGGQGCR
ncbi:periplasmic protease [Microbacterium testaceum StLB037]|uniref:Periplasmic protease n=2 Tax=Microbacterium testaceum TaxID=2033 RepID=E8NDB5_MICTS|nr:periplasmic protease [Microbacterium testaceum StLB037]